MRPGYEARWWQSRDTSTQAPPTQPGYEARWWQSRDQGDLWSAVQSRTCGCNLTFDPWKSSNQEPQKGTIERSSIVFADQKTWSRLQTLLQATYKWPPLASQSRTDFYGFGSCISTTWHMGGNILLTTVVQSNYNCLRTGMGWMWEEVFLVCHLV